MTQTTTSNIETLVSLVDKLEEFGDRPAVIQFTREGRETWPYARLANEAGRLAGGLREAGAERGENVAVMAEPSPEWFVAGLGILRAGAVLVPIDAQMSDADLERVFNDSDVCRIFATHRIARRLEEIKGDRELEIYLLDETGDKAREAGYEDWQKLARTGGAFTADSIGEDDPAILFYTSGTTGPPKGVPLSHRNIVFQIQAVEKTGMVNEEDRMLLPLPLHHVYPLVIGLFTPLSLGVAIILPHALTGDAIVRALSEGRGSVILGVPRLYRALYEGIRAKVGAAGSVGTGLFSGAMALARAGRRVGLPVGNLLFRPIRNKMGPNIRLLASGGSPLDPELAQNLEALGWPIAVGYGLTETSPLLTLKRPGEGGHATVGRAIDGVELKIDPSGLPEGEREAQEAGKTRHERGEVLARGPNVFSGYRNLPEKTEKALTDDGWFRTGDLGYLDEEGFLYLGGRASSMIVLEGGENINPEDLEEIYGQCEEVAEIGVLEDKGKLAALVLPERSLLRGRRGEEIRKIVEQALRRRSSGLPSYKRLSHLEIARRPLPATRLGKIKRHLLVERYEVAEKGEEEEPREKGPVPIEKLPSEDRSLLEDPRAKKLWDLLAKRYAGRRLTPDANLDIDLGIDSLEWVELSLSSPERAGFSITEDLIEKAETVRDLLEAVASAGTEEAAEGRRPIEAPEQVLSESDRKWATPRNPIALAVVAAAYGLMRIILRVRCRMDVRGLENLPEKGPYILVPNHNSYLDSPVLGVAVGFRKSRELFWAGQGEILFRSFPRRAFSRIFQIVPIDPRRGPLSSLAVSALVVKREYPLVWFPEGHISVDGTLQEFRPGIGLIVDRYEPPIIPVFIDGTHDVMPLERKFPLPGRIAVHFGERLDASALKTEAEKTEDGAIHHRIAKVLQETVRKLAESAQREEPPGGKHRKAA